MMDASVTVTFRHMQPSPALESRARALAVRLDRYCDCITSCHVVIEAPPAHRHKGAPFAVKIDVALPGSVVHVDSQRDLRVEHADAYVALRHAFNSARRQLQDIARIARGDVKHHETQESPIATIRGTGLTEDSDGAEEKGA